MKISKNNTLVVALFLVLLSILVGSCGSYLNKASDSKGIDNALPNYTQVATGQVNLYGENGEVLTNLKPGDSLYGQDANYLNAKAMAFRKNNDGTTTDLNTGLTWQEIPTTAGFNWKNANEYCENLKLGGYDDWRMPSAKELYSISDFNQGWPYIDTTYFSLVNNKFVDKSEQFWASNKYVGHTEEGQDAAAFGVNHATGHIKAYAGEEPKGRKGKQGPPAGNQPPPPGQAEGQLAQGGLRPKGNPMLKHVRAVRGAVYGTNDFVDNSDKTITDKATGLMWSKMDSAKGMDWKNALTYAENSELAGYSDWRLPNVKELQGIVDYSFAPGAKVAAQEGPAINKMFQCTTIKNENGDKDYAYYWTSTSARFQKGKSYYYAWYVAFGRAVNNEGLDFHGAGAVRFDTKHKNGPASEGGERYFNYVRLVRNVK